MGGYYGHVVSAHYFMDKWLSILIPSNRPEGLEKYIKSLRENADNFDAIEIVVLVDDERNYVEMHGNIQIYHYKRNEPLNISELQNECYRISSGRWIMLSNDDVEMKTQHWDTIIKNSTEIYPDEIALLYPEDGMFGKNLSCFPIISRKMINATRFFPQPYRRYKVDDTIFSIFPDHRKIFLGNVVQTHFNDHGTSGYQLPDGRIYPVDREAGNFDQELWFKESARRVEMTNIIYQLTGEMREARILVGVATGRQVPDGQFYDSYVALEKPAGTICTTARGQSPAKNRNMIIKLALENQCTHILFLDDDMTFPPDLLIRLFNHNKPVVTAMYYKRQYPHEPLIFKNRQPDGSCQYYYPSDEETGLIEIENCGFGAVLIKTEVFAKIPEPWLTLGTPLADEWCDDIPFFNKVVDAGYPIYCDLDIMNVGHCTNCVVYTHRKDGKLMVAYDTTGAEKVAFGMVRPSYATV